MFVSILVETKKATQVAEIITDFGNLQEPRRDVEIRRSGSKDVSCSLSLTRLVLSWFILSLSQSDLTTFVTLSSHMMMAGLMMVQFTMVS